VRRTTTTTGGASRPRSGRATDAPAATTAPAEDHRRDPADDDRRATDATGDDRRRPIDPASITFDYGVTEDTIRIGLNADLSGIFAPLVTQIVDGQEAFWEIVNDNGGIAGRQVELVILDNAYDVPKHLENYATMAAGPRACSCSASRPARRTPRRPPTTSSTTTCSRSRCRGTRASPTRRSVRT
jgi:hypothetical protein